MPADSRRLIHLIISRGDNDLVALTETQPARPPHSAYGIATIYQSLPAFLADPGIGMVVPADTPVACLDALGPQARTEFAVLGPLPGVELPRGTIASSGNRRSYRGEHWSQLGMLTPVSIDVYLHLVCQAGGTVRLARDLTDPPARPGMHPRGAKRI